MSVELPVYFGLLKQYVMQMSVDQLALLVAQMEYPALQIELGMTVVNDATPTIDWGEEYWAHILSYCSLENKAEHSKLARAVGMLCLGSYPVIMECMVSGVAPKLNLRKATAPDLGSPVAPDNSALAAPANSAQVEEASTGLPASQGIIKK